MPGIRVPFPILPILPQEFPALGKEGLHASAQCSQGPSVTPQPSKVHAACFKSHNLLLTGPGTRLETLPTSTSQQRPGPRGHAVPAAACSPEGTGTTLGQCPALQPAGWGTASPHGTGSPNLWGQLSYLLGAGEPLLPGQLGVPSHHPNNPLISTHPLHTTSPTKGVSP